MRLEDQVVSLELAKKLKELGVEQESYWHWFKSETKGDIHLNNLYFINEDDMRPSLASAFTVAELGEMIGDEWVDWKIEPEENSGGRYWEVTHYDEDSCPFVQKRLRADTEADARAKLLIHLIEEKIITPEK